MENKAQAELARNAAERLSNETSMTSEKSKDIVSINDPLI